MPLFHTNALTAVCYHHYQWNVFIIPVSLNTQRNTRFLFQNKISHHVDQGMKRAREATKGMKRSMWRTDNAKYGTSHISDVPLDLVNNSISTAEANKWKFQGGNFPHLTNITNLQLASQAPPAHHLVRLLGHNSKATWTWSSGGHLWHQRQVTWPPRQWSTTWLTRPWNALLIGCWLKCVVEQCYILA